MLQKHQGRIRVTARLAAVVAAVGLVAVPVAEAAVQTAAHRVVAGDGRRLAEWNNTGASCEVCTKRQTM